MSLHEIEMRLNKIADMLRGVKNRSPDITDYVIGNAIDMLFVLRSEIRTARIIDAANTQDMNEFNPDWGRP